MYPSVREYVYNGVDSTPIAHNVQLRVGARACGCARVDRLEIAGNQQPVSDEMLHFVQNVTYETLFKIHEDITVEVWGQ